MAWRSRSRNPEPVLVWSQSQWAFYPGPGRWLLSEPRAQQPGIKAVWVLMGLCVHVCTFFRTVRVTFFVFTTHPPTNMES